MCGQENQKNEEKDLEDKAHFGNSNKLDGFFTFF
jgi:hypothetical protein